MSSLRCPKCKCKTYNQKYGTCTADGCSLNTEVKRDEIKTLATPVPGPVRPKTPGKVRPVASEEERVVDIETGEITGKPKMGRPVNPNKKTSTERARERRERLKNATG